MPLLISANEFFLLISLYIKLVHVRVLETVCVVPYGPFRLVNLYIK